jgi:hypothetical protein
LKTEASDDLGAFFHLHPYDAVLPDRGVGVVQHLSCFEAVRSRVSFSVMLRPTRPEEKGFSLTLEVDMTRASVFSKAGDKKA